MTEFLIVLFGAVVLFCAILVILYLLVLVRPKKRRNGVEKFLIDYAHRGLHGGEIPENSLSAFKKAIDEGIGIELDIQLSKDGVVMVFHDYTLERMTGVEKLLTDLEFSELSKLKLSKTEEKIPTLEEVLSLVDGKVPLLIELKGENMDSSLCGKAAEVLKNYKGDFCIESFNPLLIKKMRSFLPDVFYGQLYTNICIDKKRYSPLVLLLSSMSFNFLSKPDFIAYNKVYRNSLFVKITTKVYKAYRFVWTARTKEEFDTAKSLGECPIFEKEA